MNDRATNGTRTNGASSHAQPANGVGCDPNPEVLPPYVEQQSDAAIRIGQVEFNHQTIIRSPCFWILVGVGLAWGISHCANRRN